MLCREARFCSAVGRKTENGEGDTRRRRGGGRVKSYKPAKNGVTWQKTQKSRDRWLKQAKGLPETSTRLSAVPWGATRIQALRAGRIPGYSNSENIDKTVVERPFSIRNSPL